MNISRQVIKGNGFEVPCIILTPQDLQGVAIVIHGYGGDKEEQLGLAYRIAEIGLKTCVIDLRGHGQHALSLNEEVLLDVEATIKYCRHFGKVVAIGHSLGGRLALISSSDFAIGISPALSTIFSEETQEILKNVRGYRVREHISGGLSELMKKLPVVNFNDNTNKSIIYGSRDIPEIRNLCKNLKTKNLSVIEVDNAMHNDIFTLESTFQSIIDKLKDYFPDTSNNHYRINENSSVLKNV
ncbi:alpha/beta hydrolase [Clostridium estertheticum]|uniref:Alpha/beta fold hydrolase n=1 Tax=Clostridium estertheticum TaxID=238834 RepID=A0A7Y3WRG0_9CLOT|nr:alpha/beta fold hydrolase [Clostridium estertheticum]MBW9151440.1 alpha/beta fold hydrolase [Clostridium estertheticum]MCB2339083.1 alpha/beta fold hydrolase [Clostridium estertheticum]NNU75061.1 alpha/beta fold hydrolase [Clostridium estertheticum]WBL48472.1 alpha/beta fold hydrolase [Clostridium estertheticum]WLC83419.1 alpha/beta fold hydrolase [Clostridium estertheticum]